MLRTIAKAFAITLVALFLIDRASLLVAPCGPGGGGYSDHKGYEKDDCATHEGIIVAGVEWLFDSPPEIWTAFASLMIAVFTGTLWYSTDKLWRSGEHQIQTSRQVAAIQARQTRISNREAKRAADAANRNARAFMSAERAYLFIQINEETASDIVSKYGRYNQSADMFDEELDTPSVGYSFKNFGRTAAILKEFSDQLVFAADLSNVAEYSIRESMPDELVVEPGAPSAILGCLLNTTFNVGNAVDFRNRKAAFWFYGYVKFDDAFGREHEWRWRFRYRRGDGRFRLVYYREFPDETDG
jgi:hypothetical protein